MLLFFDTETTDLLNFKQDLMHADQTARICQLAAALVDPETRETVEELNVLIKPEGWDTISPDAFKAHGLTVERCEAEGVPMTAALEQFNAMKARATRRIAYHINYDKRMMAREANIYGIPHDSEGLDTFCAMTNCVKIVNLPPTERMLQYGINKPKTPNLGEAYRHFFGEDFENAHDAMADVRATIKVYFAILDHKAAQESAA